MTASSDEDIENAKKFGSMQALAWASAFENATFGNLQDTIIAMELFDKSSASEYAALYSHVWHGHCGILIAVDLVKTAWDCGICDRIRAKHCVSKSPFQ